MHFDFNANLFVYGTSFIHLKPFHVENCNLNIKLYGTFVVLGFNYRKIVSLFILDYKKKKFFLFGLLIFKNCSKNSLYL